MTTELLYQMMKSSDSKNQQPFILRKVILFTESHKMNNYFKLSMITMTQR